MLHPFLRFQSQRTFIQVGAHLGDDDLIDACRRFGHKLYMFEPNPKRVADLQAKVAGAAHIRVLAMAVSNYNGHATFNIASHDDCSSLQEFDSQANQTWVHQWHPYKNFETVERIDVPVVRLDTFLEQNGIAVVDLLEIDAQGEDLRVAESLGDRIRDVKKIQLEVNIHTAPLYANSFGMGEALGFFSARQFERHLGWKQSINREENVVFRNRRFYPHAAVNAVTAGVEQQMMAAYFAAVKLPRVAAVTKTMIMRKLKGVKG